MRLMAPWRRGIVDGDADLPRGALSAGTRPRLARSRARAASQTTTARGASRLDLRRRGRLVLLPVRGRRAQTTSGTRTRSPACRSHGSSQPRRSASANPDLRERRQVMKRTLPLVLALAAAAVVATTGSAASTKRSGALHVTKECGDYHGAAGEFCTITSSNIPAIKPGMRVVYLAASFAQLEAGQRHRHFRGPAAPRSATSCSTARRRRDVSSRAEPANSPGSRPTPSSHGGGRRVALDGTYSFTHPTTTECLARKS